MVGIHGVLRIVEHWCDRSMIASNAVGLPWDCIELDRTPRDGICFVNARHSSAVRSPTTLWERLGSAVRSQCERRGCVLFGACTSLQWRPLQCYCVVTPWRFDGVATECYVIHRVLTATVRSCHDNHCALTASTTLCYCVVTALLRRCHVAYLLTFWKRLIGRRYRSFQLKKEGDFALKKMCTYISS